MEELNCLSETLASRFEWLAVRESGKTLSLRRDEIELKEVGDKVLFGFVDEKGFAFRRVRSVSIEDKGIVIGLRSRFGADDEEMRLIPRASAAELAANIEYARLERANEIAQILIDNIDGLVPHCLSLNTTNGRSAEILVRFKGKRLIGVLVDVTGTISHESLFASALKWLHHLRARTRDGAEEVWIAAENRQARALQRLFPLLAKGSKQNLRIISIDRTAEPPRAEFLSELRLSDLWRGRPQKLAIPAEIITSRTTRSIIQEDPHSIDVVFSRRGETLRFNGLPFARVRKVLGREAAWFGTDKVQRRLDQRTQPELAGMIDELRIHRSPKSSNRRNELFRRMSEAWLESILRRNIKQLDPNLELSPVYNQFHSSNDKIDLLAIRRDGRLVIIELKISPDPLFVLQAVDYWRRIESQRRKGILNHGRLFGERIIADRPALVYCVAPALSFHYDFDRFARLLVPEIELWRWELHEDWRSEIKVIRRISYQHKH
ncbi:hypothetical protein [Leptolyngbya sp. 7M]|uniref:hypothetical protein n=1 Tax=Leptolyngbya sp. 7M TaxID=2812896 RepID=UPI001B8BA8E5|nr:hypothetical protein [Leptolyngbya sp. 7M]QYO65418.1 hypothetical protein JVX88_01130 [Leptolyngbya sp. 7M]